MFNFLFLFGPMAMLRSATIFLAVSVLPSMADDVVLTINGDSGDPVKLSFADLQALPASSFETTTIWTEGKQKFTGVSLKDLLSELSLSGKTLRAKALNDYSIEIPIADAVENGPIVAYFLDDERMSVRDKGPLWIVYPYDLEERYQTEVFYSRSIWQLDRIDLID